QRSAILTGGPFCAPIRGPVCTPIDSLQLRQAPQGIAIANTLSGHLQRMDKKPSIFKINPHQLIPGPYTRGFYQEVESIPVGIAPGFCAPRRKHRQLTQIHTLIRSLNVIRWQADINEGQRLRT
ncbi:hypothetical protein, partial [Sphingobium aquiterrae]|uniref:hypothetical protein n=1 Tax=Sphingobium aquiterrae TaxID=2038656 RepID=UPI003017C8C4